MNFDEIYKFIGYCFVCLLIFYIVARSIRFQVGIIEGLVGKKTKAPSEVVADLSGNEIEEDSE